MRLRLSVGLTKRSPEKPVLLSALAANEARACRSRPPAGVQCLASHNRRGSFLNGRCGGLIACRPHEICRKPRDSPHGSPRVWPAEWFSSPGRASTFLS